MPEWLLYVIIGCALIIPLALWVADHLLGFGPIDPLPKKQDVPFADEVPPGWRGQVQPRNAPAASTSSNADPKPPPKD